MYFEDLKVGQKAMGTSVTITEAHNVIFGGITGDLHWLHQNEEKARQTVFGRRIAYGMLTASVALASVSAIAEDDAVTHLGDTFTYRDPVYLGDTITTECEVTELVPKRNWGLTKIRLHTRNQHNKTVMEGEVILGIRYRPKD